MQKKGKFKVSNRNFFKKKQEQNHNRKNVKVEKTYLHTYY